MGSPDLRADDDRAGGWDRRPAPAIARRRATDRPPALRPGGALDSEGRVAYVSCTSESGRPHVAGCEGAMPPEVRYAQSGEYNIAYQVIGDGPRDLILNHGWVSNIDAFWEQPLWVRFFERLASFARVIQFDKRGTGLSDRVPVQQLPTLEERMDDVRAVMDAAGSERAALYGYSEGGAMCALFAASYPERTSGLIMDGAFARRLWAPDYP